MIPAPRLRALAALLLAACGGRPPAVPATRVVVVVPAPMASDGPASSAPPRVPTPTSPATPAPAAPATCTLAVDASPTIVPPSCFIDDRMGGKRGTLLYPCDGDGEAKLVLGDMSIPAVVQDGELSATVTTEFDWQDGCHWRTFQSARGSVAGKVLVVEYREASDPAPQPCFPPCEGHGEMHLR